MKKQLELIEDEIVNSCKKAARNREDVVLVAVSKTQPIEKIKALYDLGIRDFGENKVQELRDKYDQLPKDIRWHLIGHLQTNKIKYIIDKVTTIQSIDSVRLADAIDKEAGKHNRIIELFIQVNIGNEEQKNGIDINDLPDLIQHISGLHHVRLIGLMAIPPVADEIMQNRHYFRQMKQLLVDSALKNRDNITIKFLSMGMSDDFQIAIEEGANYIRVGTKLFGSR